MTMNYDKSIGYGGNAVRSGGEASASRWQGDTDYDKDEYVRHASRFYGRETPSASSAVVETVYRKPREYADVHEYDEVPVVDRIRTAVGYHSMDSVEELESERSRHSRYEVAEEREEKEAERVESTQVNERETKVTSIEPTAIDSIDLDQDNNAPEVENDESFLSEDSDSCEAMWRSASEEELLLKGRDYDEALKEAKRVKALNEVGREQVESVEEHNEEYEDIDDDNDEEIESIVVDGEDQAYRTSNSSTKTEELPVAKHGGRWSPFGIPWGRQLKRLNIDNKDAQDAETNRRFQFGSARAETSKQKKQRKEASRERNTNMARRTNTGVATRAAPSATPSRSSVLAHTSDKLKGTSADPYELPLTESVANMSVQKSILEVKISSTDPDKTQMDKVPSSDSKSKQIKSARQSYESRETSAVENVPSDSKSKRSNGGATKSTKSSKSKDMSVGEMIAVGSNSTKKFQSQSMKSGEVSQKASAGRLDNEQTNFLVSSNLSLRSRSRNDDKELQSQGRSRTTGKEAFSTAQEDSISHGQSEASGWLRRRSSGDAREYKHNGRAGQFGSCQDRSTASLPEQIVHKDTKTGGSRKSYGSSQMHLEPEGKIQESRSEHSRSRKSTRSNEMNFDDEYDEMTSPPPIREIIPVTQGIRSSNTRSHQGEESVKSREEEYADDVKFIEDQSAVTPIPHVSNDDIIEAVRGQNNAPDSKIENAVDVGSKLDSLTSWIMSGFDSVANAGLEVPIGFLDWSGEETTRQQLQVVAGGASKQVQSYNGVSTLKRVTLLGKSGTVDNPKRISTIESHSRQLTTIPETAGDYPGIDQSRNKLADASALHREGRENRTSPASEPQVGETQDGFFQQKFYQFLGGVTSAQRYTGEGDKRDVVRSKGIGEFKSLDLDSKGRNNSTRLDDIVGMESMISRDLVSISSIEIPTPSKALTRDDEYSVSILGLEKERKKVEQVVLQQQKTQQQQKMQQKLDSTEVKQHKQGKRAPSSNGKGKEKHRTGKPPNRRPVPQKQQSSIVGQMLGRNKASKK